MKWTGLGLALVAGGTFWLTQALAQVEPGPLPPKYVLGQEQYVQRCNSCHLALPPETFPSQTWRTLLSQSNHYGKNLPEIGSLERQLIYLYLKDYSRTLKEGEAIPYYLSESRYFRALHPKVVLPRPLNTQSCTQCHQGAKQGNYQATAQMLTPDTPARP
ncbi:hypothetical protein [Candidatus Cyanaurora vandensis]|uniref:hypothetical protein n=1 Tax=Candidatus Cyanaurora vandensis TaxID=2714958 RepID=UPI00257A59A0|nr:hypothetical protein [Candidatus Cyanaurora vandensis]